MKSTPRKKSVTLHNVTLEQFAGVRTALSEGIDLGQVLAQESIDPAAWLEAERAWTEAIADSPALGVELVQKTAFAEDCLARSVDPLETDASAWMGLLTQLATAGDSDAVMEKLGFTASDMARLGRNWKRKAEADPKLVKQLEELAPKAKPPTRVTVGPTTLRPFPWTPARTKPAAAPDACDAPPIVAVPVAATSRPVEQALATYQLRQLEQAATPSQNFNSPLNALVTPTPPAASYPKPSHLVGVPPSALTPTPVQPRAPVGSGTAAVDASVVAAGLALAAARAGKSQPAPSPAAPAAAPSFAPGTLFAPDAPLGGQAVPFRVAPDAPPSGSTPRPEAKPATTGTIFAPEAAGPRKAMPFQAISTGTVFASDDAPTGPAFPFQSASATEPVSGVPGELSLEEYARLTAAVKAASKEELPAVLARFKLSVARFEQISVTWKARLSGNIGLSVRFTDLATEYTAKLKDRTAEASNPPSEPTSAPKDVPHSMPNLSLEQYATFRAALTLRGVDDAETWRQFGVQSATMREALQSSFAARFQRDEREREEFVRLVREATRALNRAR